MDYVVNSEPILRFAYFAGTGSVLVSLLLVLDIIRLRLHSARRERRKHQFIDVWRELLNEALLAQDEDARSALFRRLPAIAPRDEVFFLSYWNQLQASVRGGARTNLNLIARAIGMDDAARRLLEHGKGAEKLLALVSLSYCGTRADKSLLQESLYDDQPLACLHAVRALIHIDAEVPRKLLRTIIQRTDVSLAAVASLLREAGANAISEVLAALLLESLGETASSEYLTRLVALAAIAHPEVVREPLCLVLDRTEDPDVMAHCIKVMHHPEVLARIRKFASHPDSQVRVQVASALGDIGEAADVELLKSLLADPQWWVRYRAGQALVRLPFLPPARLAAIRNELRDGFAVDMLDQVISEQASCNN